MYAFFLWNSLCQDQENEIFPTLLQYGYQMQILIAYWGEISLLAKPSPKQQVPSWKNGERRYKFYKKKKFMP